MCHHLVNQISKRYMKIDGKVKKVLLEILLYLSSSRGCNCGGAADAYRVRPNSSCILVSTSIYSTSLGYLICFQTFDIWTFIK